MARGAVVRRSLATWTFYAVFYGFAWLVLTSLGLGATTAPATTTAGVDFTWLYPLLLAFVPVVGLLLLTMKRQV